MQITPIYRCYIVFLVFVSISFLVGNVGCQAGELENMSKNYDIALLPISNKDLKDELLKDPHNVDLMVQLIRHASMQNNAAYAFEVIQQLQKEKPDDMYILAEYLFAYQHARGFIAYRSVHANDSLKLEISYKASLMKLQKYLPNIWLTNYLVGHSKLRDLQNQRDGLNYLLKAEKMAPENPYIHYDLSMYYLLPKSLNGELHSERKAYEAVRKACTMKPVIINAPIEWYWLALYGSIAKKDLYKAAQAVVDAVPPGVDLDKDTKKFVDMAKETLKQAHK